MQPVMGVVLTGNANCDASGAIANGALNDCTTALAHGSECTPTCDTGYVISGIRSCSGGTLIDTAVCISSPYEHGRRLLLASSWTQVGGDIDGEAAGDKSGSSVSMSSDGTRMAIGAHDERRHRHHDDAGHVRVYSESGGTWTQLGGDIDGEAAVDETGFGLLGIDVLGRHARGHRRSGRTMGRVAPHQMTAATCACMNTTRRRPVRLRSGLRLAATSTARLRATSPGGRYRCPRTARAWRSARAVNDGTSGSTSDSRGHVRVYSESGGTWTQVGADIDGEAAGD